MSIINFADAEQTRTNAQEYSRFGAPTTNNLYSSAKFKPSVNEQEVNCCLPGSYLNCPSLIQTDYTSDCPILMSQLCAESFDDKCALYANTKAHSDITMYRKFLRDTLKNRFCQLSPDSDCVKSCTPFNPAAPDGSHLVCRIIGKEPMIDVSPNSTLDVGLNLPVNLSPTYQGNCQLVCNAKTPASIEAQDPIVNECIRTGFCADILRQICQDTDVSKSPNQLLQTYCGVGSNTAQQIAVNNNPNGTIGTDTYNNDTYNTYTYPSSGTSLSSRASQALTAIRQKLSSAPNKSQPHYTDDGNSSDYSLLYVFVLLILFYAILYMMWKGKMQYKNHGDRVY
jgi:hypothetical protein